MTTSEHHDRARSDLEDELTLLLLDPEQDEPEAHQVRLDVGDVPDVLR
ncbi:MAG TPA: hypothetical protein VK065_03035 [Brevibacterium sp.]|nr:hypothetical protein [Brevibacterium sp.]